MIGRIFFAILCLFLLFGAFASPISDGIKGWRTEDTTQSFIVATAAAVTTANVTLSRELYQSNTSEIISLSSTLEESPVATSYDTDNQYLLISALNADTSRTITLEYYGETDNEVMQAIGPFLNFLIIGGLAALVLFAAWKVKGK
jgi:anti-sigma-K factor RskA